MRILIVDDHALMVEGLSNLLRSRGFDVVGTAENGREGVVQALLLEPDLVLMDISMPVCDGLAATRLIKSQRPDIKIVMLTTSAEDEDLFEAIRSGACGYLLKSVKGPAFVEALHGLEEGAPPFSPGLAARLLREFGRLRGGGDEGMRGSENRGTGQATDQAMISPRAPSPSPNPPFPRPVDARPVAASSAPSRLTERQMEILRLVASGLTYKEVGAQMALSDHTVRYHMAEIMNLLHLENRSQVIAYAGKLGLEHRQE